MRRFPVSRFLLPLGLALLCALPASAAPAPAAKQTPQQTQPAARPAPRNPQGAERVPSRRNPSGNYVVFFTPWSATPNTRDVGILQAAARQAKRFPLSTVTVLGYADMEGSTKANLDLAKARVDAVAKILTGQGYPKEQITLRPIGSVQPIGDAQESRRVEITIRVP